MVLHNVHINGKTSGSDIHMEHGWITAVTETKIADSGLRFENAIAFPGLINSHDHLDFNSFPLLGNKTYDNYVAWGNDIHAQNSDAIAAVLQIPKSLRVQWSLYKNLLNGVTTVVQHGEHFEADNDLANVFQDCVSIHSVRQEKKWKLKLNKPRANDWPVVIHIGEGTNKDASAEIDELIRWNLLRKKLIGIHGVAMSPAQAKHFKALIWCPDPNYFLLDKTADISVLKKIVPVIFGTDSTLTGHWSLWEQLRVALATGMAKKEELFHMLTTLPAEVWGLKAAGKLDTGAVADIVVARAGENSNYLDSFFSLKPEDILLVIHDGNIRLFDETLLNQLQTMSNFPAAFFSKILIGGVAKYVFGDLPSLMKDVRSFAPDIVFPDISIP